MAAITARFRSRFTQRQPLLRLRLGTAPIQLRLVHNEWLTCVSRSSLRSYVPLRDSEMRRSTASISDPAAIPAHSSSRARSRRGHAAGRPVTVGGL
jgi:hypothetical protein